MSLFAAGSPKAAPLEVAADYTEANGVPITPSFGPSGLMCERIEAGEPAHVFAPASMRHPQTLGSAGKGGPVAPVARSRLCALARQGVVISPETLADVLLSDDTRIGTSMPTADPSRDCAFELFDKSDHAEALKRRSLQPAERPDSAEPSEGRNTCTRVLDSDRADDFPTYCTDAVLAKKAVRGLQIVQVPETHSDGADDGLIVLDGAPPEAWNFAMRTLSPAGQSVSPAGQSVLTDFGFGTTTLPTGN